jgi:preprotein translocase subunit SecY
VPSRIVGVKTTHSTRDKLTATVVGAAIGGVICTPPYLLARIGVLMLGSKVLFIPGVILLIIGVTLEAGTVGAVRTVKMSAKLVSRRNRAGDKAPSGDTPYLDETGLPPFGRRPRAHR